MPWKAEFDPICPKTLCSLSPRPMMPHIKFDQDWPTGFRDIQVQKCEIFLIRPEIELDLNFYACPGYHDSIKNERASMETPFSHYKSMGIFLDAQGQLTSWSVVRSGRNLILFEILCMTSLPASIKRIRSKATEKRWRHHFSHYKSMGAFCCHGCHGHPEF